MTRGRTPGLPTVFAAGASEPDEADVTGSWSGTLVAGTQRIEIFFHIGGTGAGSLGGTMDVPAQGATGIPLTEVTLDGERLTLAFPVPGGGTYEGVAGAEGRTISGTFTQGGQAFPMELAPTDPPPTPVRPQEPTPPFPYDVHEVVVPTAADGVTLAGTLTIPKGAGPVPGAVLVSGSGPQDRDETILGHKPFFVLADHLTRTGIAVLRYDDRGVGASTGDHATATSEDRAADASAAVRWLTEHPGVDPESVGVIGHSEGGLIGPMAADRGAPIAWMVLLAGPGVTGLEILVEQGRLINAAEGAAQELTDFNAEIQTLLAGITADTPDRDDAAEKMRVAIRERIASVPPQTKEAVTAAMTDEAISRAVTQMNSPWFRFFLHYAPVPALERTEVPVLALFGEKDLQVPAAQSAHEVEAALARGGNPDATVQTLPGLNHLFQTAGSGSPSEYRTIEETFSPAALTRISEWLAERFPSTHGSDNG